MARKKKTVDPEDTRFYAGAIYSVKQFGISHTALCLDVCDEPTKRIAVFRLKGYPDEDVEEGSERGNQFKLVWKPGQA